MNSSESKKVKRRKNKRNDSTKPVSNYLANIESGSNQDMDLMAINMKQPEKRNISNHLQNNSEVLTKLEQMMDAADDPLPTLAGSQGRNPYFNVDKCLICQKEKTASVTIPGQGLESGDDVGVLPDIGAFSQLPLWVCPDCRCSMEEEQKIGSGGETLKLSSDLRIPASGIETSAFSALAAVQSDTSNIVNTCLCPVCKEKREFQHEQEIEGLQLSQCWSELRQAVRQVYQDVGIGYTEENVVKQPSPEKLRKIVHRLCLCSPHQLFLWLESQGRELVIGMKIKLLKHLSHGINSPQLAKLFITDMLDDYAKLCSACKKLHPILKELEQDHLKALSFNWELVIRHLFQSLVYLDNRVQCVLPSLITQLRSVVDDENEQKLMNTLLHKYLIFDEQMTIVAVMWREADPVLQELNMEQATLKANQRMLHDDWDLYKVQRKILEQQMLKKAEATAHRCSCEDCTLKYMLTCGLIPHPGATQMAAESGMAPVQDAGGHYLPSGFMSSMMNNMDSLESVLCGMPPTIGFPSLKEHCCGSSSSVQSGGALGCLKSACSIEEDARFWVQTLPPGNGNPDHVPPLPLQHCVPGCPVEQGGLETHLAGGPAELPDVGLSPPASVQTDRICASGNQGCQCPLCVSSMPAPNSVFAEKSSVPTVEKSNTEHPCECHVCVQHADRATIPTVVSAPPRPAALHLYPHIHGSYAGPTLHNPHVFKPFLPAHLYGVHLPALPRSKHSFTNPLTDAETAVPHSVLQECLETYNGGLDLDIVYENAKLLLSSRKCADSLPSVAPTLGSPMKPPNASELEAPPCASSSPHVETLASSVAGNAGCPLAVDASAKKALEMESRKSAAAIPALMSAAVTTHSNKGTQASGPLGCAQAFAGLAHAPLDFHHVKPHAHVHAHNNHGGLTANGVAGAVLQDQGGTKCAVDGGHSTSPCATRPNVVNGKTSLHSCNVAGHHGLPHVAVPNKQPCKGVADSRYSPPENHCASPLGSCPNQELDNFHGDTEESVDDSCSEQSSSTSTSNQKDNKHCDCCYCEVFGHDVTALPPVSRNYPEMREKLRQRLNRKKLECKDDCVSQPGRKAPPEDRRDLDSLISFINGSVPDLIEEFNSSNKLSSPKALKKSSKRQKKVESKPHKPESDREDLTGKSCSCHSAVHEKVAVLLSGCKPAADSKDNLSLIESCSRWAGVTSSAGGTNSVGTMTSSLIEGDNVFAKPAAEAKVKCVGVDCKKRMCLENEILDQFKSMAAGDNGGRTEAQLERDEWPLEPSGRVNSSSETNCPPFKSQLLPALSRTSNTSPVNVPSSHEKPSKKKRKASPQTLPLASSSSLSSSSSSGVSSCGSNGSSSKDDNFCLNMIADFKQLQLTVASKKRHAPSSLLDSNLAACENGVPPPTNSCQFDDVGHYAQPPSSSPSSSGSNRHVSGTNGQKRRQVSAPRKATVSLVSNCADPVARYGGCVISTASSAKLKSRKDDRRKSDSFQNCVPCPPPSSPKSEKVLGNSGCKMNGKLPICCNDLNLASIKTSGKYNKRNKKKANPSGESSTTDDVFVPRDIDLDNDELDEMERELEAFKRFCWNSVPLANKEKVNVNLKDIIIIRKKTELGCS